MVRALRMHLKNMATDLTPSHHRQPHHHHSSPQQYVSKSTSGNYPMSSGMGSRHHMAGGGGVGGRGGIGAHEGGLPVPPGTALAMTMSALTSGSLPHTNNIGGMGEEGYGGVYPPRLSAREREEEAGLALALSRDQLRLKRVYQSQALQQPSQGNNNSSSNNNMTFSPSLMQMQMQQQQLLGNQGQGPVLSASGSSVGSGGVSLPSVMPSPLTTTVAVMPPHNNSLPSSNAHGERVSSTTTPSSVINTKTGGSATGTSVGTGPESGVGVGVGVGTTGASSHQIGSPGVSVMVAGQTFWEAVQEVFVTLLQDPVEDEIAIPVTARSVIH